MRRARAAAGSLVFLALVPGVVAGVVPWLLTGWHSAGPPTAVGVAGFVLCAAGTAALLHAFGRFVVDGLGTPAPLAPTERLVVSGLYRHVRNPMYLAVGAVIAGQALVLGRPVLALYGAAYALAVALFVRRYEEPTLARRFGEEYAAYLRAVPGWRPRLRPWEPGAPGGREVPPARLSR